MKAVSFLRSRRAVAIALLVGCCAAAAIVGASAAAKPQLTKATFRLDYLAQGYHAAFFLALDRGYYRQQGIDLTIEPGQGSSSTSQLVAAGNDTFGMASVPVVAAAESKVGNSLMDVCSFMQRPADAIISLKKNPITSVSQLYGKSVGFPVGAETVPWDAFLASAHLDGSKIKRVGLSFATYYPSLENGKVDGLVAWTFDGFQINKVTPIAKPLLYSSSGVDMLSEALIVTKSTLQKNPSLVAGFVKASIEGMDAAAKDPKAALAAELKYQPKVDKATGAEMLQQMPYLMHTPASAGHSYCWTSPKDVAATQSVLQKYAGLPSSVNLSAQVTNQFVK